MSSPKYGQTANVKSLSGDRVLLFAVKWPNLDFKVSYNVLFLREMSLLVCVTQKSSKRV